MSIVSMPAFRYTGERRRGMQRFRRARKKVLFYESEVF